MTINWLRNKFFWGKIIYSIIFTAFVKITLPLGKVNLNLPNRYFGLFDLFESGFG